MKQSWASDGFTILEIMVSVVVVAILATIMLVSYDGIQQRSRDATRESHATQIKIALDKYYAANSQYPAVCSGDNVACPALTLAPALAEYLPSIPRDPRYEGAAQDYEYIRGTPSNRYGIRVTYEARPICKDGVRIDSVWWGGIPNC